VRIVRSVSPGAKTVADGQRVASAQAFDVAAVGGLLITLSRSAGSLRVVVLAIRK
jgi:hypothetical protein